MTEETINNGIEAQDQIQTSTVSNEPEITQDSQGQRNLSEETISKSRANDIIHQRTREVSQKSEAKGYERGRNEALEELKRTQSQQSMGGIPQSNEEQIRYLMRQELEQHEAKQAEQYKQQYLRQQIVDLGNRYMAKISAASEKYPDLINRQDEIKEIASLVPFIDETDEVAGITQHLLDNGNNVASLMVLAQNSPSFLRRELKKLAESIKTNDAARNRPNINEPIQFPNSSNHTMDSGSGSSSVESLKNQDWLRV